MNRTKKVIHAKNERQINSNPVRFCFVVRVAILIPKAVVFLCSLLTISDNIFLKKKMKNISRYVSDKPKKNNYCNKIDNILSSLLQIYIKKKEFQPIFILILHKLYNILQILIYFL